MGKRAKIVVALILIALGALWSFQGAGWIGGSFMSGDRTWLVVGIALAVAGLALLIRALRRG